MDIICSKSELFFFFFFFFFFCASSLLGVTYGTDFFFFFFDLCYRYGYIYTNTLALCSVVSTMVDMVFFTFSDDGLI